MIEEPEAQDGDASTADAEQAMHLHRPKPLHGVREILTEIGIIVVGIAIALAGEQLVEHMRWAHEVGQAHDSLKAEMALANGFFAIRVAASACVERRLDMLDDVIEKAAQHKPVQKLGSIGGEPYIGSGLSDSKWQAQRAAQTLTHFDETELGLLGYYYHQLESVADLVFREDDAWAELRILEGDPARLGPEDFAGLRRALQHARFDNYLITSISGKELRFAKALHMEAPEPDRSRLEKVCGGVR